MMCCIILHNMYMEDREEANGTPLREQPMSDAVIRGNAAPLWTAPGSSLESHTALVGSLPALCATSEKMRDLQEYAKTRNLIMDHLWQRQGNL